MFNSRLLIISLVTFIINIQPVFSEKKNPPKNDDVIEESLKLAGDTHFQKNLNLTILEQLNMRKLTIIHILGTMTMVHIE